MAETRDENRKSTALEFQGEKSKKYLACSLEATTHMKEHMSMVNRKIAEGEPVAWVYTGTPFEIFQAMDVMQVDSVYYSALCSAKQMSRYYLDTLNSKDYFRDLCRYCTVPLGYAFDKKPEIAPRGGLPKFTCAVGFRQDDPIQKIWEIYAREFDIPLYLIEKPYRSRFPKAERWFEEQREADAEIEQYMAEAVASEYEGLVRFLETYTGKHLSLTRLRETVDNGNKMLEWYWKATDIACHARPCPISWTDTLCARAAIYDQGTQWAIDFAKKYHDEVKERVDKGVGVCENEKVRLCWEGHPVWFSLGFYNSWEDRGAVFLPMYYLAGREISMRRDVNDPIWALARRQANMLDGRLPTLRKQWMTHICSKYGVDGTIFMVVESCKLLYASVVFSRQALHEIGIPTLEINADMVDARDWDDTKMKSLVTSFIETLSA